MAVESPTVDSQPAKAAALSQPLYGATIGQAIARFFGKYATFSGRASRSEFWWVYLAYVVVGVAIMIPLSAVGITNVTVTADYQIVYGPGYWTVWTISLIVTLALLVPFLAIFWRRLHDTNRSGGYYFLAFIPFVGPIIVIVLLALPSSPAGARFDR
ncbi:DUF805 domain-containing protein [Agromyces sp. Soil535]|uniref:DUF805 domain-containing protein n=1 Tax=Agromyces sp. Soil535 TaxID=1736390 RepID=UPI0006F632FA|nr:DUF805 domain-containing protein [Agromyces sp. Soil535]KRE30393.1 hypothetical protein ASG80_16675 [Agromyces sp. Soil535]